MKNNFVVIAIVILTVGAAAFFGGMKYQESKTLSVNSPRQFQNGTGTANGRQNGQNAQGGIRPVTGEILNIDDKSITVKLTDGSSKIVLISDKTSINKASEGTRSDLKVGEKVLATGSSNSDGSVSATSIQINPSFGGGPGRTSNQTQ